MTPLGMYPMLKRRMKGRNCNHFVKVQHHVEHEQLLTEPNGLILRSYVNLGFCKVNIFIDFSYVSQLAT